MNVTRQQFNESVAQLLGTERYQDLLKAGFNAADFVGEIAKRAFINSLPEVSEDERHLAVVRQIAVNLWDADGTLGFVD